MPRTRLALLALAVLAALVPASAPASASGVVVSELRFRGPAGASDEFVELVNAGSAAVDLSGWRLQACSATTGTAVTRVTLPAGTTLAPGQHLLVANSTAYSGDVAADLTYATGIADGGGVRIVTSDGLPVDGAGSAAPATSECREGAGLTLPTTDSTTSLERRGGTQDTDDNAADFETADSDPQSSASVAPSLSIDDVTVQEGDEARFTVTLSAASRRTVAVAYATADGTAASPGDYAPASGTVALPPGETAATIVVSTVADALDEPDETFSVELGAAARATVADATGTATIRDDDEAPDPDPDPAPDSDADGVADDADNCPAAANGDQSDRDGDGAGDVCDAHPAGTPGAAFVLGAVSGGGVLAAHARYDGGAKAPTGFVQYWDPRRGVLLSARELIALVLGDGSVVVTGRTTAATGARPFRLELAGRRVSLEWGGSLVAGRLAGIARIRAL